MLGIDWTLRNIALTAALVLLTIDSAALLWFLKVRGAKGVDAMAPILLSVAGTAILTTLPVKTGRFLPQLQ